MRQTPPDEATSGVKHTFSALKIRTYAWWFATQVLSASGTMTQAVAQSWLLLQLTGSAVELGALTTATFGPVLLLSAWAGGVVDRVDHRRLLLMTQSIYLVLGATLGVLSATGAIRVWQLFAMAVLTGAVTAFDQPVRQVFVLELVGAERTGSAISLNEVVLNASRVVGPAVGGAIIATIGVTTCFFVNAATYLPPLAVLVILVKPGTAHVALGRERRRGHLREGLRYVARTPIVRSTMLMAVASGMLFNLGVSVPLMATRVFHTGGGGYGALMSCFGVGAIFGALFAAAGSAWPSARRVRLLALLTGLAILGGAVAPRYGVLAASLVVDGFLSIWFVALANTMVQVRTAPELRGRVMGIWTMALPGMNPVTGPATGVVAELLGARASFASAGVAFLVTAGLGWRALSDREDVPAGRVAGVGVGA
jgi:MFS family permease